jgi:hypothetical protein
MRQQLHGIRFAGLLFMPGKDGASYMSGIHLM